MPGAEVQLLEKMIIDDTLRLVDKYEIEWTDRNNPVMRARRIYVQLMLESGGFDFLYLTRLEDIRKAFQLNRTFKDVIKYFDWTKISSSDTYAHYLQRPNL